LRVLENDGNCSDAVIVAAAAALKSFRRPDCVVVDGSVTVAAAADVCLTLHALPVSVTFAVFQLANGEQVRLASHSLTCIPSHAHPACHQVGVIDPTSAEEAAALSHVTVCMSVTPPASVLFFEHRGFGMRVKMLQDIVHVAKQRCARNRTNNQ
jgi:exosome complex RNA-binding protein Rrp42 (RNase PH superfamily)